MIQDLVDHLHINKDCRATLSQLRQLIKDKEAFGALYELVDQDTGFFCSLLNHEDAKTRKNAALLLGDLGMESTLMQLWTAYEQETQNFVKSSYLSAMKNLDYDPLLSKLQQRVLELSCKEVSLENRKHVDEELRELNDMIIRAEGINTHTFTGYLHEHDCILLTNRDYTEVTANQIEQGELLPFPAGVRVKTGQLRPLLDIRTYQELLFVIPGTPVCANDPVLAAKQLANSALLTMLKQDHKGTLPFYFRIELKSKMMLDKKAAFTKKLGSALEQCSNRALLNSPGDYEFELRLIENKEGNYNVLVKYQTLPDLRFDYRKEHVSSSMKPWLAALLAALAKDFMVKDAQVLDPFCGVATMLIERQKAVKGNTAYGIDTSSEAIAKAKVNTEQAGQIIHFVQRNFFSFTHEYLFDEIFTNMPWAIGRVTDSDIQDLYSQFFAHAKSLLTPDGVIIIYTHDADYARHYGIRNGYEIKKSYAIHKKEGTALMILGK